MKFTLNILKRHRDEERGWPDYMFGGHVRTSTLALILAFLVVWWVYDTYRPPPHPSSEMPSTQVVPPGFVPDPNYTWVPRSRVNQPPPTVTVTPTTPPTTTPPTTTPTTTSPTPPPLFQLPVLPPPFGPPPSTTSAPPGPGPVPGPVPGLPPFGR